MVNSIREEFIGNPVEIINSKNKYLVGLKGKVVDETRNAFKILAKKKNFQEFKIVMKKDNFFKINNRIINGNKIMRKCEERVKLKD